MGTRRVGSSWIWALVLGFGVTAGCHDEARGDATEPLEVTSASFSQGGTIPKKHACDGRNVSPPLAWHGAPKGTQAFALVVDDPDAPHGTFVHWVAYDLPADATSLAEAASSTGMPGDAKQGKNDFGKVGYGGMCPPPGKGAHRYFFRVYALDAPVGLAPGATKADLTTAIQGHILAQGHLMARYARQ